MDFCFKPHQNCFINDQNNEKACQTLTDVLLTDVPNSAAPNFWIKIALFFGKYYNNPDKIFLQKSQILIFNILIYMYKAVELNSSVACVSCWDNQFFQTISFIRLLAKS